MIDLTQVDAYEYCDADDFIRTSPTDHPLFNKVKMCGSTLKLYVKGAVIILTGCEAAEVYNMLNETP